MDRSLFPLVDGFPDGSNAVLHVGWRIGSLGGLFITSARRRLSRRSAHRPYRLSRAVLLVVRRAGSLFTYVRWRLFQRFARRNTRGMVRSWVHSFLPLVDDITDVSRAVVHVGSLAKSLAGSLITSTRRRLSRQFSRAIARRMARRMARRIIR